MTNIAHLMERQVVMEKRIQNQEREIYRLRSEITTLLNVIDRQSKVMKQMQEDKRVRLEVNGKV